MVADFGRVVDCVKRGVNVERLDMAGVGARHAALWRLQGLAVHQLLFDLTNISHQLVLLLDCN